MNGIITTSRYARTLDLPISFAQTELRSGKAITITQIPLAQGQRLELRSLTIVLAAVLTPGVVPVYLNSFLHLCSVGLYRGPMLCSPLAHAVVSDGASTTNPFAPCVIETAGTYSIIVSNNTNNTDMAVIATGSAKIYF